MRSRCLKSYSLLLNLSTPLLHLLNTTSIPFVAVNQTYYSIRGRRSLHVVIILYSKIFGGEDTENLVQVLEIVFVTAESFYIPSTPIEDDIDAMFCSESDVLFNSRTSKKLLEH